MPTSDLLTRTFGARRKFHYLTVDRLDAKRSNAASGKDRKLFWFCTCKCGNTASVRTAYLKNGHTRSCGCLRDEKSARNLPAATSNKKREAYKQKEVIRDGEEVWYSPGKASRYLTPPISTVTLAKWANLGSGKKRGCPLLNGRAVRSRKLSGTFNRKIVYYRKDDLDELSDARAKFSQPEHPGLVEVSVAIRELGVSDDTLRRLCNKQSVKKVKKPTCSTGWLVRHRAYLPSWFVEKLKTEATAAADPPKGWLTVADAARELEVAPHYVHELIARKLLDARRDWRKPVRCVGRWGKPMHAKRKALLVSRASIEAFMRKRKGEPAPAPSAPAAPPRPQAVERKKGGRPRSPRTTALHKFCYEQRQRYKASVVMMLANAADAFGKGAIKDVSDVAIYARRYAERLEN